MSDDSETRLLRIARERGYRLERSPGLYTRDGVDQRLYDIFKGDEFMGVADESSIVSLLIELDTMEESSAAAWSTAG
jgi:hypothetical protein